MQILQPGEIPIVNRSGGTISAGSLARIAGRDSVASDFWEVAQPNAADQRNICVVPEDLPEDAKGVGLLLDHPRVLKHSVGASLAAGDWLGTESGSWQAAAGNTLLVWSCNSTEATAVAAARAGAMPFKFTGDLDERAVDPYWSGGSWTPSSAGETKELYTAIDTTSYNPTVRPWYGIPIRAGQVHRLEAHMQNLLSGTNEIILYPVTYLAASPGPDLTDPWPLVLTVTGGLTPDATGTYVRCGNHNDKPAYVRTDGAYWIFYKDGMSGWWITVILGDTSGLGWASSGRGLIATYGPGGGAVGTATAAITPWVTLNNSNRIGHSIFYPAGVEDDEVLSVFMQTTVVSSWGYVYGSYPLITAIAEQAPFAA